MSHQRQSYLPRHHHHHNTVSQKICKKKFAISQNFIFLLFHNFSNFQGNMQQQQDTLRRRVQSPRRRDYKDFSAAPAQRDFR